MNRRVYAHVCIYAFLSTHMRILIRVYIYAHTRILIRTYAYLYAHTRILIRTYSHTYTHIRVHLYAYYARFLLNVYLSGTVCGSIVANPIIYRFVPSPSRFEIRQWWMFCCESLTITDILAVFKNRPSKGIFCESLLLSDECFTSASYMYTQFRY